MVCVCELDLNMVGEIDLFYSSIEDILRLKRRQNWLPRFDELFYNYSKCNYMILKDSVGPIYRLRRNQNYIPELIFRKWRFFWLGNECELIIDGLIDIFVQMDVIRVDFDHGILNGRKMLCLQRGDIKKYSGELFRSKYLATFRFK